MKKLGLSIVSIFLVFVTLASSTFAWLTLNQTAYVDGLELKVTGGENILLSVDQVNWHQNLSKENVIKAIVAKYKGFEFNENEELVVPQSNTVVSYEEVLFWFENKIRLGALTSSDGKVLKDLYGNEINESFGKYVSFDLYFTCESDSISEDASVFFYHDVDKILPDGNIIEATKITSSEVAVPLKNQLTTFDQLTGAPKTYYATDDNGDRTKINVNPANALRFSVNDVYNNSSKIYELQAYNEDNKLSNDLGSYATDFTNYVDTCNYMCAYDANKNAGFTYYNNLKSNKLTPLSYEGMPKTIKKFDSYDNAKVCELKSTFGYEAKVNFKFWLEGWDADCFDGIGNTKTSINLTFTTKVDVDYDFINVKFYKDVNDDTPFAEYANANPGMYLTPALAPNVAGKKFKGWAVVLADGSVDTKVYDQSITLQSLITSYYDVPTDELKLVALFEDII